jgi:gamma-glutamyltranspeptidase/glutathione hydrolase
VSHPFDWSAGYASQRSPVFARNIVSTSHPLAAQAGLQMLRAGGNAVDAAIATAAMMTIVEPCSNGLGSDAFAILWDPATGQLHGLNASGCAPAAWTPGYFASKYGADATNPPKRGWDSVTVPGAVSAWAALSQRFGKLPFADLMAPAIETAERGYAVPVIVQSKWANAAALPELTTQPGFAATFLPKGREPQVGELWALPEAARSLRLIAETQGEAFYRGEIAAALATHARAHGGSMTEADLAAYQPEWVQPIAQAYRGHELHEIPPNGQGIAALIALGILQHFDLASLKVDSAQSQHLQIEAMKLAFADVYRYVGEPRSMQLTPTQMLDPAYLKARRADRPAARAGLRPRPRPHRRHHLPDRGRCLRDDGQLHPEQLHGLRQRCGGAGLWREPAEPRPRLHAGQDARQRRRPGQAAVPDHHPRLPDPGRPAGDELWRDGR